MKFTCEQIGELIKATRKNMGATQRDLAMTSNTGLRFIVDLEKGKKTCQIGKALKVLNTLGVAITLTPPESAIRKGKN